MSGFDSARFRHVLGHFPTGVTIITAAPESGPVGLTIGSFTSVSLDPPLVGFLPGKASTTWPGIEEAGAFCVNVLGEAQGELCWSFARESNEKFVDLVWEPAPATGSPVLPGVVAWIDCEIEKVVDAGDHWFVLGRVLALDVSPDDAGPLLFFRGKLGGYVIGS
jgi:flavin reductase (DIM6/NTAB) family NADH-FMN oxidoreductase RutF